ncbi:hypothetical protein F5883DRAFT_648672 [Diaporthe sp. PMI_573]|nr:hypothetical protein F5883DRAFT_648672 [Diaporthaceae sp. PMI_573]
MPECDVRASLNEVSADDAKAIPAELNAALGMLAGLQGQRELHTAKQAKLGELEGAVLEHSARIATYGQIIENESATWQNLEADREVLRDEMDRLAADRSLLDFWASSLAQKSRRFVLDQSLAELNTVITQILTILFEDSRHATALTTGMLRSLFAGDRSAAETVGEDEQDTSAAALDSSLSVDARLSYGKRSGGERKRIDLALFFALLYVGFKYLAPSIC